MPTKLQRKLLCVILGEGQKRALIMTGHKSTSWGDLLKSGGVIIRCSECVKGGLIANKWIEKETDSYSSDPKDHMYRITRAGEKACGREEPEMKILSHGRHGIRWG